LAHAQATRTAKPSAVARRSSSRFGRLRAPSSTATEEDQSVGVHPRRARRLGLMCDFAKGGSRRSATSSCAHGQPPNAAAVRRRPVRLPAHGLEPCLIGSRCLASLPARAFGCARLAWPASEGKALQTLPGQRWATPCRNAPWGNAPLRTAALSRKRHSAAPPSCGQGVGGAFVRVAEWGRQEDHTLGSFRPRTFTRGRRDAHHHPRLCCGAGCNGGEAREGGFARDRQIRLRTIGKGRTLCYRAGRTPRPAFLPPATLHLHQDRRP
jgi:hypothetical protein